MSTGQILNTLEYILDRIQQDISRQSLTLSVKGSTLKVSDSGYHAFWAKLDGYQKQLAQIVHQLTTIEANLDFRGRLAHKLPRGDMRYRARQSLKSHGSHMQQVYEKAVEVEQALRGLYGQGQTPTTADLMKGVDKLSKEVMKTLSQQEYQTITTQLQKGRPHLDNLTRDIPVTQNVPVGFIVSLIVAWIALRKRKKDD